MTSHFISTKIELEKRDEHPQIGPKSKNLEKYFFDKFSKKYFFVFLVFLDDSKIFQIFFRFFRFFSDFFEKKNENFEIENFRNRKNHILFPSPSFGAPQLPRAVSSIPLISIVNNWKHYWSS